MIILDWLCAKLCKKQTTSIPVSAPIFYDPILPSRKQNRDCMSCKWSNQGENSFTCFNKASEEFKGYCYYGFTCSMHEFGDRMSDKEMKNLGYKQKTKTLTLYDKSKYSYKFWQ